MNELQHFVPSFFISPLDCSHALHAKAQPKAEAHSKYCLQPCVKKLHIYSERSVGDDTSH